MPTQDTKTPVRKRGHLRGMEGDKAAAREGRSKAKRAAGSIQPPANSHLVVFVFFLACCPGANFLASPGYVCFWPGANFLAPPGDFCIWPGAKSLDDFDDWAFAGVSSKANAAATSMGNRILNPPSCECRPHS